MPTLQKKLLDRWNETKNREDISLEDYLKTFTTIFNVYKKTNQGKKELTMDMITNRVAEHHDVGIDGATSIVHTPTATNDDGAITAV